MTVRTDCLLACTLVAALAAGSALAQTAQPPAAGAGANAMVTVDLTGTKPQIAQSTGLAAGSIPDSVQIPPSYAARLCEGTPAGGSSCKATKNDEAFNAALKSQMAKTPPTQTTTPPANKPGG